MRPSTPETVGPEWAALLRLLPGYDPFAHTGGAWFDDGKAQDAIAFIEQCVTHVEGALKGSPFLLSPWQKCYVGNLFGWQRIDSEGRQVRRYKESLLYVPRKNGKTPLAAAIALYVFFCDGEPGMQGYIAAADAEQAGILFRQCKGMVEQEPEMDGRCRAFGGTSAAGQVRSLVRHDDASFLRVISAVAETKHGGNSHLILIDELHAQPDRDLVDVMSTSTASLNRAQTLLILITTADFDRPSVCNEKHAYACAVRDDPSVDPAFLPAVWEASDKDDWRLPATWEKANPNLGVSVSREYLEREFKKAETNPDLEMTLRRLHLNQKTATSTKGIDPACWDALPIVTAEQLEGMPCWGGLDLSSTTDLTAFALVFRPPEGVEVPWKWAALVWCWTPKDTARARGKKDRVSYEAWGQQGFIKLTEGNVIDGDRVRADIVELGKKYEIQEIAYDRWGASHIATQLQGDGFALVGFGQGYASMSGPTKEFLACVAARQAEPGEDDEGARAKPLARQDNPCLRWQAINMSVTTDAAEQKKPDKAKSADRIDGIVAIIMGLGRAMVAPEGVSAYDSRGIMVL